MIRTMAASMATERSSSTRFLLCEDSTLATGIRIFLMLLLNLGFPQKESVELILLLAGVLVRILCFPHDNECSSGFRVGSSKLSVSFNSLNPMDFPSLNEFNT